MARFSVDVKLKILVLEQETSARFEHQEVVGILLRDQVGVVAVGDRSPDLNDLTRHLTGEK